MDNKQGKLYIVGTPLGNLGDISPRALKTLEEADFIAAEDTRVSIKLLNHFGIKKPLVSYYEHNARERGAAIIERILSGESCALVTDAGMPCISDPGEDLVRLCAENGIETVVVPGPTAMASALAVSGLPSGRFTFEGFLSVKKSSRFSHLEQIKRDERTLIFYEAPHKLLPTLRDMLDFLGNRRITIARELTKLHEEIIRTTISGALAMYSGEDRSPRGEYVLVVEGAASARDTEIKEIPLDEAVNAARELVSGGMPPSAAAREAAKLTGHKKGDIYKALTQDHSL